MENISKKLKFLKMMILMRLFKSLGMILILAKMLGKDYLNKFKNKFRWMMMIDYVLYQVIFNLYYYFIDR